MSNQNEGVSSSAEHAGNHLVSDWLTIDQERIDLFAKATSDLDPFHIDPDYARQYSPYGTTIAFGFLTISLLTHLYRSSVRETRNGFALNYGFDRLRLPNTVPVGSRVRGKFLLKSVEQRGEGKALFIYEAIVEIEGQTRPALVADWLAMWIEDGVRRPIHVAD